MSIAAARDGFLSYDYERGEAIGLEENTIMAKIRVRGHDAVPTSFTLPIVPVYFRCDALLITIEVVRRDYNKYRGLADNPEKWLLKVSMWMLCSIKTCRGSTRESW